MYWLKDKFVIIVLKVSLYAFALILTNGLIACEYTYATFRTALNGSGAVGSLFNMVHDGVKDRGSFVLFVITALLYRGRGILLSSVSLRLIFCMDKADCCPVVFIC
jgi:hypothetical protein